MRRISRRLLFTGGAGALGVTVLTTVTGCSSSSSSPSPSATTTPAETPIAAASGAVAGDWRQVKMSFVSAYVLVRGGEAAIVDLGTPGSGSAIEEGLKAAGSGWSAVKHVILTHLHNDHVGGLTDAAPKISGSIYAGSNDLASIISDKPLKPLVDGDEVFGLRIVETPGHTLGHISVLEPSTGILIAGDALRNQGTLQGSAPENTTDEAKAAASVRKLAGLDIKAILPGHGEPLTAGAARALKDLAATMPS
ncbi:MBL fold metallo-hydrolase [Paractinoplanes toevensis]|uniref:Metallo-beta-lactamase domain-containing protein n=1 Tax=Paractinoplanes toevensis TaxID=571911 RepID=A0A919WDN8_9ACTN|nr:MBL fold metallo-hydrolase [Actinoplanes toevensis]GIM98183.1 hypothetical protein Ato02nite_099760 [Actinoplanes toevensis]